MSNQPMIQETRKTQVLAPNPTATFTGDPSTEARLAWGHFLAFKLEDETAHEERVFSTPGVVEALDEAIAEIKAVEESP
jgi:hypothetical protein